MIFDSVLADETSEKLLRIAAIKLNLDNFFTWASGWKSPMYCDNRLTLSYPDIRNFLKEHMSGMIEQRYEKPNAIVGVATGAIAIGVLIADILGIPFMYVRPEAKKHGRQNQIEGHLEIEKDALVDVVVVEDLISTGKSSLSAVEALRAAKFNVKGMVAIFSYGFPIAEQAFKAAGVDLLTLTDYETTIRKAMHHHYIDERELKVIENFRKNPRAWTQGI